MGAKKMSEILTIDTAAGIQTTEKIEPLPIYGEDFPLLQKTIPEYKGDFPNPALVTLAKRIKMTMKLYAGLGLSANQCGVSERIFVLGTDEFQIVCVNPKVIKRSDTVTKIKEGCLSYPGLFLSIDRPDWIEVEYMDEHGTVKEGRLEGVSAQCFLHELDHLNGVRYTDYIKPVALQMARKKQKKIIKTIARKAKNERLATRV
jgi:peptide deformylase